MAMVCPQCKRSYEQRLHCPQCGVRLNYQVGRYLRGDGAAETDDWQQTPWGRLFVGLLLSQGVYYVLHHLLTAGLLATREPVEGVWAALTSLMIVQGLQVMSVLAAGLLTGAGQRRGLLFGAVVGVWNGVFFMLAQSGFNRPLASFTLYSEPIMQAAFGALGGLIGSLIWRPSPPLILPEVKPVALAGVSTRKKASALDGPIAWTRVLTGITLAVGGVVWVNVIRDFLLEASEKQLRIETHLQAELVTWEISALAILVGSALAGAGTRNGFKQGLCVGIGTAVILLIVRLASTAFAPHQMLIIVLSALGLGMAGGWFGGQLLPPLYGPPRRKRARVASF
jgi:hypothetical protein